MTNGMFMESIAIISCIIQERTRGIDLTRIKALN